MIQIEFETTRADFQAFQLFVASSVRGRSSWSRTTWLGIGGGLVFGIVLGVSGVDLQIHVPTAAACVGLFGAFWLYARWQFARATAPSERGAFLGRRQTSFDEVGVQDSSANHNSLTTWSGVLAVEETPAYVFLMIDRFAGYIVPKRAFESSAQLREFLAFARTRVGGTR